ncbi:MAG: thiamine-phosphate kinase [bacterium]|nr:MAG: thiamine-phosphate kinase [bacterium]
MKISDIGEFGLIDIIESRAGRSSYPVLIGIGDDASVLDVDPRDDVVTTTDMLVEGIHFLLDKTPPADLGFKSHAVNLSDIASMGAIPVQSFLSLGLPPGTEVSQVEEFIDGFLEAGPGVQLSGGDTVSSPSGWLISVTVIGKAPSGKVLRRDAARPGETIWLCGPVGDSAAGLALLSGQMSASDENQARFLVEKHNRPRPQMRMGRILLQSDISRCAIDVSDGLLQDLGHICRRSDVGADIAVEDVPLSPQLREFARFNGADPLRWALGGGEDYSLIFTVSPEREDLLRRILEQEGIGAVPVGRTSEERGIRLTQGGQPFKLPEHWGYNHFRKDPHP